MGLQFDIVTLFTDYFTSPLTQSILKRAVKEGKIRVNVHNLRDFTHDRHRTADDKPFGGGAGMLMKPEPLFECVENIQNRKTGRNGARRTKGWVVLLDPHGKPFSQAVARRLSRKRKIILIAGHYEGVDHRVREHLADEQISVGDFVTMGGEAPALCVIEAVSRLLPGVLGNKESLRHESFQDNELEYPQYTRPRNYRGWIVPETLISGNHKEVEKWRREASQKMTQERQTNLYPKKRSY